jgi:hypothetical protein
MILGFGTFGTGTALLYLDVNPYLLVLTDTVVGVGMLFAAGSLTVDDLHLRRKGAAGGGPSDGVDTLSPGGAEGSPGLRASLGKLGGSLRPAIGRLSMGKEEKEEKTEEIDRMLDTTLAGQSRRLISIAEGRAAASGAPAAAAGTAPQETDLLEEFSAAGMTTPFPIDQGTDEEATPREGILKPGSSPAGGAPPAHREADETKEEIQANVLSLADEELGADDLLSALRREAMREKKRDDTSLLRDLRGVKVTGRQLLEELDTLVREMRGR